MYYALYIRKKKQTMATSQVGSNGISLQAP